MQVDTICLENLIGVTKNTLIPFYDELTEDMRDNILLSKSGLYIDDLPGGVDLVTVDDVDYMTGLLTLGLQAREQAIKTLSDELLLAINNRYQAGKTKFNGNIGRLTVSATSTSSGLLQGHRYRMEEPIAGFITINKISVAVSGAATFNVYIGRCDHWEPAIQETLYTFPVTSVIGNWADCDLSSATGGIQLPMQIEGIPQEYYIYWNRTEAGGLLPKNNEIKCTTCSGVNTNKALDSFMEFHGISFGSTDVLRNVNIDKKGHGLSVYATVGCNTSNLICREYEKKEAVQLIINWAALYKAGELWIEYIQKSGYVNKSNLQNREYLWGKRNHFRAEFDKRITVIANEMQLGETGCYSCKDDKIQKGTIFS